MWCMVQCCDVEQERGVVPNIRGARCSVVKQGMGSPIYTVYSAVLWIWGWVRGVDTNLVRGTVAKKYQILN